MSSETQEETESVAEDDAVVETENGERYRALSVNKSGETDNDSE